MKKLVTLLLSLALVLSLAACGGEATPDASDDAPASSQNEESTENDNTENQIVFEEVVAIDNAECAVKITEIDPDNMWGYTLKAQLENKSTEKTYMFSVESASINGVQCDPMFAIEVAAGKKANEEINFSTDTLEENGIVEYTDIELTFKVYDSNDWSADPVGKETIHVYPYGEENAVAFVREEQATDNVIIDNYSNGAKREKNLSKPTKATSLSGTPPTVSCTQICRRVQSLSRCPSGRKNLTN